MELWFKFKRFCGNILAYCIGLIFGAWFWYIMARYSYNEIIEKFNHMSKFWKDMFWLILCLVLWGLDGGEEVPVSSSERIRALVQNTIGPSNMLDLYKYVKKYYETSEEDAA